MPKLQGHFVIYCNNFPSFCPIDVLFSEIDSQVYEDNFQLFLTNKEGNLGKENDAGKFDVFCKTHFYA